MCWTVSRTGAVISWGLLVAWQPHSEHKTPGESQQERENTDENYSQYVQHNL